MCNNEGYTGRMDGWTGAELIGTRFTKLQNNSYFKGTFFMLNKWCKSQAIKVALKKSSILNVFQLKNDSQLLF